MGLILQGTHISVDHACRDWLLTVPEGNPTEEQLGDLRVWSVFRRMLHSGKQRRDRTARQLGDNCPLIYALKSKEGLTTDRLSIQKLLQSFTIILEEIARREPQGYQMVISMPSDHQISPIVGRRFARRFNARHLTDAFCKITVEEAFRLLDRADISVEEARSLSFRIKNQARESGFKSNFSMKAIPVGLRGIFPPLKWCNHPHLTENPNSILLVDDLLASGTTLLTAQRLLKDRFPTSKIQAACLFSSAGTRRP